MADILTHLRELSFGYGILKKGKIEFNDTPLEFLEYCQQNIKNCQHLSRNKISKYQNNFSEEELNTINNGLRLGNLVYSKNIINNTDNLQVVWTGIETQSGETFDMSINNTHFSLKEDSYILNNMGLYKLVNIVTNSTKYKRGLHIFKEFASDEFEKWFETTRDLMIEILKVESFNIQDRQRNNIKLAYSSSADSLYLFFFNNEERIFEFSTCDYTTFVNKTTAKYREKVFSKFINKMLSKNEIYLQAKKQCVENAGKNFLSFLSKNKSENPSLISLYELFRISQESYYYAKTTDKYIEIYKVPSRSEFLAQVKIKDIYYGVASSQLNIFTVIENTFTQKKVILKNELRYSHGQLNGTPEAKMYIHEGTLEVAYERIK